VAPLLHFGYPSLDCNGHREQEEEEAYDDDENNEELGRIEYFLMTAGSYNSVINSLPSRIIDTRGAPFLHSGYTILGCNGQREEESEEEEEPEAYDDEENNEEFGSIECFLITTELKSLCRKVASKVA